jgi:hypothetical protein
MNEYKKGFKNMGEGEIILASIILEILQKLCLNLKLKK